MEVDDVRKRLFKLLDGRAKFLFPVAILILLALCAFSYSFFGESENTLIREQAWEKQQDINLLCGIVDKLIEMDDASGSYHGYEEILEFAVGFIEKEYTSTYAQIFDEDLNPLIPVSPGIGGGVKHNPLTYKEFKDAVTTNEDGSLVYWYETPEAGGRYIHMSFKWVPSDVNYTTRYLVAVGISKFTIKESIDNRSIYSVCASIIIAAFYIIGTTFVLCRTGCKIERRKKER